MTHNKTVHGYAMGEDEDYKKFIVKGRIIGIICFLFVLPSIIMTFMGFETTLILSMLAFAVIISAPFFISILADRKRNLSKNDDILAGNEKAKSPSDKKVVNTINIPEDYIPELNQEQSKIVTVNSFNLGGNDLGNEIAGNVIFIGLSFVFYLSSSHNYDQAFNIMFLYSLLYSLLAFWRFRTAYFKKGWVKVFARPNNIVEFDKVTEGAATKGLLTEGWTFTFDEQQYNIRQRSRNHYRDEREIYWNPNTNKLLINHSGYKVLLFLYSLVAYFLFCVGLLFSDQLFLSPVMVFIFAPVFPTGLIIICEMYFNQVSLRAALSNLVVTVLILVALIGVLALLVLAAAFEDWLISDSGCSYWMYLASGC